MADVSLADVRGAAGRIANITHRTPVFSSQRFDEAAGVACFFKGENFQRGGAFKLRGAANFLLSMTEEQRSRGVVTFSSGNHAQAVAIVARELGVSATIVMPADAPKAKLEATRSYGARIVPYDRLHENREAIGQRIASESGSTVVPPFDHPWIVAGQGTAAVELLDDVSGLDALAVPLGGGGLLSGTLIAAKSLNPSIKVFGVEPELANDWALSLAAGERVAIPVPQTIADGLRTVQPGAVTFPIIKSLVDDVLLVTEEEMKQTIRFLLTRLKILAEPSGAAGAAAVLHQKLPRRLKRVGVIVSGGNIDLDMLAGICGQVG
jgi:threonine dehydratase